MGMANNCHNSQDGANVTLTLLRISVPPSSHARLRFSRGRRRRSATSGEAELCGGKRKRSLAVGIRGVKQASAEGYVPFPACHFFAQICALFAHN